MPIPFVKAVANGNDFLIVEDRYLPAEAQAAAELTRRLCHRNTGVGADGVEWVSPDPQHIRARLLNSDGSFAEVSGNGTRCVAAWAVAYADAPQTVAVHTDAGVKTCHLERRDGSLFHFRADMGTPVVTGLQSITLSGRIVEGFVSSMGNPHFSVFVPSNDSPLHELAPAIESHPHFPERTNVELVRVLDRSTIEVRFFERGAGWTLSSGTGSCAAAVAAIASGQCDRKLLVRSLGGDQLVSWDANVWLTGPATLVCRGEFID